MITYDEQIDTNWNNLDSQIVVDLLIIDKTETVCSLGKQWLM